MILENKTAIITAAGSGMGRAAALLFASEGAKVAVVDVSEAAGRETCRLVAAQGGDAHAFGADLANGGICREVAAEAIEWLGGLDILWNHAGIPGTAAVEDITDEQFQLAMDVNVRSGFLMTGQAVPHMKRRGGGAILFTSSTSGLAGAPTSPLYAAGKFGVVGLTKSFALRYAADNIRVNAICPGPIRTPMTPQFFRTDDPEVMERKERAVLATVPMGRFGRAEEVAHAGLWLASDRASFVTGVALPVDGGYLAR